MLTLAPNLKLPADSVTQTFAILAKRGVGKTHTASVLAEELLKAGLPAVVIDPTGAWWGLRSSRDGRQPAYPVVIFGGEKADVPLDPAAGETIANAIASQRFSAIIDLSLMRKGESQRFVAGFLETLYRKNREALHLIVDEADTFAPQRVMGEEARACGAMEDVVKKGRIRGLGCTLITQRPAVLNKNVLSQCESLIAMRVTHPRDIDAIGEWVGVHADEAEWKKVIASLPSLAVGEAWFWSPGWLQKLLRVNIRARETFDSSATPKAGQSRPMPRSMADIDIAGISKQVAEMVDKAKADDPKELRKRIAELERQLKARPAERVEVEKIVEVPVLKNGQLDRTEKIADRLESIVAKVTTEASELRRLIAPAAAPRPMAKVAPKTFTPQVKRITVAAPKKDYLPGKENLGKAERAILTAIYWLRNESTTPAKVGFYADYSAGSGSFNNALGRLRSTGLLSAWTITPEGIAEVESSGVDDKPTGADLREWLSRKLGRAENMLLDALCEVHPRRLSAEELGEKSGYSPGSGSFNNALGKLRSIEAIEGGWREGGPKASDVFFEE